MIHIATVHWKDDRWIDVQLKYLQRHVKEPFRTYAFLNHLPRDHSGKFWYSSTEPIKEHAIKLNILADMAGFNSRSMDDILIFIDGDAFPVKDPLPLIRDKIGSHKLIAVQRMENNGDRQPHPSFCATTVGFWREIRGDWKRGYCWNNPQGKPATDVGGNLLKILEDGGIDWYPLLRSNKRDLHPVYFGIYGGIIYHHGSGFRQGLTRALRAAGEVYDRKLLSRVLDTVPGSRITAPLIRKIHPAHRYRRDAADRNAAQNQLMWEKIQQDPKFYEELT
jgi:hypothetical protein